MVDGFVIKAPKKPKPKVYRAKMHVYEGFPHYSSTPAYHCMCLQECCQWEDGCVCKHCPCHYGIPHGEKR
jgi:hypothetical protein